MGRSRTAFTACGVVAALVVAGALAMPAGAHRAGYDSRVTAHTSNNIDYRGRVFSGPPCIRGRTVKLYDADTGNQLGEPDKTGPEGRWHIRVLTPGSGYYAKVLRRVITRGDHRHVCRADRSPTTPY